MMIPKNILKPLLAVSFFCLVNMAFVHAQENAMLPFLNTFTEYKKNVLDEKIFVHTDRSFYITGETMWFKFYCVDGTFNKPLSVSKVGYIEVLDKDYKVVLQSKIALTHDGTGSGSLFLPASITSGHYQLRAYTHWMKNFSPALYFQQTITLINPFTALGIKPVVAGHSPHYDVQFFPEGGNLVTGLESVVAFRGVDQQGKGIRFNGAILDQRNDTIVHFQAQQFGMGKFRFTPLPDHTYKAIIVDSKNNLSTYKIPEPFTQGYSLHVSDTAATLTVTVKTHNMQNETPLVYLLAHTRKIIKVAELKFLKNSEATFTINKDMLGEGVSHLTLFNAEMKPVCERLYFKRPQQALNVTLQQGQLQYTPRKKITVSVATQVANTAVPASLSMAVYKIDSLQEPVPMISDYLWLTSELKGTLESPAYYLQKNETPEQKEATDNLMLTQGWSRFRWEDIQNIKSFRYIPECDGHIVTGKVTDKFTGLPAKSVMTYLSSPGKLTRLYVSRSNEDGVVMFEMQNFFGSDEVIAQTNATRDSIYTITLTSPYADVKPSYTLPVFTFSTALKENLNQRSIHMQIQNTFSEQPAEVTVKKSEHDSTAFFGPPDEHYRLDDYTRFPTMEEVMREYIPGVMVRKRKDGFHFMNLDHTNKTIFRDDPLILIDGVPVFDTDKIMEFDPHKIKSIDVMTQKYYLGSLSFDGIVSYKTYRGDLAGFQLDPKAFIVNYEGLQRQQEFFSPQYETQPQRESTLPDVRNLLYWNPAVKTDDKGQCQVSFYSSDITGKYKIEIQGLDKDGVPGHATTTLEVRDKLNY